MGAAATKHLQPDKTKHAAIVLDAVRAYEESHPDYDETEKFQLSKFKRHVLLAVTAAKKAGKDVENSMAQLNDQDLEMLWGYIQKHRQEDKSKKPVEKMTVEEFVDEENAGNDNIDETTSVLSYGDDDVGGDGDSEIEMESSGSLQKRHTGTRMSSNDVEDLEDEHEETTDLRDNAVKIFPADQLIEGQPLSALEIGSFSEKLSASKKSKDKSEIAEALAKFWEIDDLGSMTSQLSIGKGSFSPISPRKSPRKNTYKDRGKRIDERNEALLGLQRQKVISYTQNAQLEREVEALQKQLERIEQLEKSIDPQLQSPNVHRPLLNQSMQSTSSTIQDSVTKVQRTNNSIEKNWDPKFPYIYPIDEETNEWNGSHYHTPTDKSVISARKAIGRRQNASGKKDKAIILSSSEDEDNRSQIKRKILAENPESKGEITNSFGKNVENQLSQIKSVGQNGLRRKPKLNYGSGVDSDDSTNKMLSLGQNKSRPTNGSGNPQSDTENQSKNPYISPRLGYLKSKPDINLKKMEGRKARNTIGNDDVKPSPKEFNLDEDKSEIGLSVVNSRRKGNEKLKNLNRRRHSLDETPQKESDISSDALLNTPLPGILNNPPLPSEKLSLSPDLQKSEEKRPLKRIIRRKRGGSEGQLEGNNDSDAPVANEKDFRKIPLDPLPAEVDRVNDSPDGKLNVVPSSVIHSEDEKASHAPIRRRRVKAMQKIDVNKEPIMEDESGWTKDLDFKWAEVSLLLRKPIKNEEDMQYCVAAAEAGIIFTDQMNNIAKSLQVLRGALSRWILPFDNNTRIETQCSTPHSVVENMPDEFRGKLTERQVHYLVAGANGVRKLVRVKIADDNDLEQARKALQTINNFFKLLYTQANKEETTPFQLLLKSGTL